MIIGRAQESDLIEIVELLKKSLGQSKLPKTLKIWAYKHVENPFGESIVLIGRENNEIIGVRAFMKWEWVQNNTKFKCLRAVDTATHPDHQGKGVFKKLTLAALEIAKDEGYSFIFNTPNTQSLPGYLKMGWAKVSKLNVQIALTNPIFWRFNYSDLIYKRREFSPLDESLLSINNERLSKKNTLFTLKTNDYFKWRYYYNPLQEYEIVSNPDFFVACYVKKHHRFNELRCSEFIYKDENGKEMAIKALRRIAKKIGVQIISSHPFGGTLNKLQIGGMFGPILTFRNLNLNDIQLTDFNQLENWNYTLGDLELF